MKEVVIASAARLPVGRLGGSLLNTEEVNMAVAVIREAMKRANNLDYKEVDELVMGQNFRTGLLNSNCARIFAIEFNYAPEIKFLERYYNIDKAPAIVINFQDTLIGVQDFEVIEEILLKWKKE